MPAYQSAELKVTDWLANNFQAWEVTDELRELAALFGIDIDAVIGTGIRVVELQAYKTGELWADPNIEGEYEPRPVWAVIQGPPDEAVILHLEPTEDEQKALAWAEQERFRQANETAP